MLPVYTWFKIANGTRYLLESAKHDIYSFGTPIDAEVKQVNGKG